ncbi:hypothetical protein A4H97_00765 [Niastella yeongjuensis]|uniref:Carbohydrate-binding family V/XII n=1 Tax=Niastella yeongjuensis TaxID=354355 RepID=A0A1V9EW81_9BACT|nr:hypothetical protein [Niastella yeongjuensis]OQP50407.1 hypothetical protein A4H97_00765 [Niastella yeongjuensis]SEN35808.1 hypothetical protein SAMN05660816_00795 [Niastella yeongjuensis]
MKIFTLVAVVVGSMITHLVMAQENWPKTATTSEGTIVKLYQWQPESFEDNTLKAHAAISVLENGKTEPVFGVAWLKATTETAGSQVNVKSIYITNIKLPGETDDDKLDGIANVLEDKTPSWDISFPLSDLQTSLDLNKQQTSLASQINNTPPKVIYTNVPSILVSIDGDPKLQSNKDWGVEAVVNTPFVLVKNHDSKYYLYGGKHWYTAPAATGPYKIITEIPSNLSKIETQIKEADKKNNTEDGKESDDNTIYNIVVTTEPAELIQSKGEANFAAVEGTGLLYVSNSENDIFMDINSQQYYVLLSGRWYTSKTLSGNWKFVEADKLPAEFAKIPKGSPKDNVLASVAGTEQANDAVEDAQLPQTAKVERNKAKADINYDGDPEFEAIDGTDMSYATNTSGSVIRANGRYYTVDDGVWFESNNAAGPWAVSVNRPAAVALIPPRYPVYYMKYVYIYDVTPDYVYMGYTPGYLNAYVYGPTVVYGTGYYYRPWYGHYYYPRPYTWGFGIRYNPWFGWGFGVGFGYDWFNVSIGFGGGYPYGYYGCGGWWGPRVYRPCYYGPSYYYRGGYYGHNSYYSYRSHSNVTIVNNYYSNTNIYRNRGGVVTRTYSGYNRPYTGGRYVGNPGYGRNGYGRNGYSNNGGYGRNGYNNGGRFGSGNYNNNGGFTRGNNTGGRPVTSPGGRTVTTPNGGNRVWTNPRNSTGFSNPGGNRTFNGNSNNLPRSGDRFQAPDNRPQRTFEMPSRGNNSSGNGNYGSRPNPQPQGGGFSRSSGNFGSRPGTQPQGGGGSIPRSGGSFGGGGGSPRTYSPPSRGGSSGSGGGGNGGGRIRRGG